VRISTENFTSLILHDDGYAASAAVGISSAYAAYDLASVVRDIHE